MSHLGVNLIQFGTNSVVTACEYVSLVLVGYFSKIIGGKLV